MGVAKEDAEVSSQATAAPKYSTPTKGGKIRTPTDAPYFRLSDFEIQGQPKLQDDLSRAAVDFDLDRDRQDIGRLARRNFDRAGLGPFFVAFPGDGALLGM